MENIRRAAGASGDRLVLVCGGHANQAEEEEHMSIATTKPNMLCVCQHMGDHGLSEE